jgi:hypothetical protein
MLATLFHYDEVDTLPGNLIFNLSPPQQHDFHERFLWRESGFNRVEQAAILTFLETYLQLHPEDYIEGSPYLPMLKNAIEFWKSELKSA